MKSDFIGRVDEKNKICAILNDTSSIKPKIISIGGPGGVGKSSLLDEVMDLDDWDRRGYLIVRIDSNEMKTLENIILDDFIKNAKMELGGGYGYFKETEKCVRILQEIDVEFEKMVRKAARKNKKWNESEIDSIVHVIFALGKGMNHCFTETEKYINFGKLEASKFDKDIKNILNTVNNDMAGGFLSNIIPDITGNKNYRERLRNDRNRELAEALDTDLHTILFGAKDIKSKMKPTQSKMDKFNRIIMIFEEYESKQKIMDKFLIHYFIPKLKKAKFDSVIMVVGRDILTNISSDWSQKWKKHIVFECDLDKFSDEEARQYLKLMEITEIDMTSKLIEHTEGYPYLLEIEIENIKAHKGNAHANKMFYDRTTKWMNKIQKCWFENICYLDVVNEDTIRALLPDEDAEEVYAWFENEPSIRDTSSDHYAVKAFIKKKIMRYIETKSPTTHKERLIKINELLNN
jgi:hypothetical protein